MRLLAALNRLRKARRARRLVRACDWHACRAKEAYDEAVQIYCELERRAAPGLK